MPITIGANEGAIPEGSYTAILEKVELTVITSQYGTNEMRKWHFLLSVDGVGTPLSGLTSMNNSVGSKTYLYLQALLRRPLRAGETIDDPIGSRVLVNVITNAKGYSTIGSLSPIAEQEQVVAGIPR